MKPGFHCVSSLLLSCMAKMSGRAKESFVPYSRKVMEAMRLDGGWHCAKSRARDQKLEATDSCPMDNLNVLRFMGCYEESLTDPRFNGAADFLLMHWRRRAEPLRPYGFGIGTQFQKLKYPEVKYGILQVLDTLSLYPCARGKKEYRGHAGAYKKQRRGRQICAGVGPLRCLTASTLRKKKSPAGG